MQAASAADSPGGASWGRDSCGGGSPRPLDTPPRQSNAEVRFSFGHGRGGASLRSGPRVARPPCRRDPTPIHPLPRSTSGHAHSSALSALPAPFSGQQGARPSTAVHSPYRARHRDRACQHVPRSGAIYLPPRPPASGALMETDLPNWALVPLPRGRRRDTAKTGGRWVGQRTACVQPARVSPLPPS